MASDLSAHHQRATPNQMTDAHLGPTRTQPRHYRAQSRAASIRRHPMTRLQTESPPHEIAYPDDTADTTTTSHKRKSSFTVTLHF